MKTHIEIRIQLKRMPDGGLHAILRDFAKQTQGWDFPKDQSEEYQRHHGSDAGFAVLLPDNETESAAIAIANLDPKRPNSLGVPNIVPRECSSLTLDQYNAIGLAFANDFRRWLRCGSFRGTVEVVGPNRT